MSLSIYSVCVHNVYNFLALDEEAGFERRKEKSMAMARARCLPMNFHPEDITGILKSRDQARGGVIGGSLADVDPMTIDTKVSNLETLGYTCPDISSR